MPCMCFGGGKRCLSAALLACCPEQSATQHVFQYTTNGRQTRLAHTRHGRRGKAEAKERECFRRTLNDVIDPRFAHDLICLHTEAQVREQAAAVQGSWLVPVEHEASARGFGRGVRIPERGAEAGQPSRTGTSLHARGCGVAGQNWAKLQQTSRETCCRASTDSDSTQNRGRVVPDVQRQSGVRNRSKEEERRAKVSFALALLADLEEWLDPSRNLRNEWSISRERSWQR